MKRYLIPILIVLLIVAGIIYIPDMIQTPDELTKESTSPQSPTHDELQAQIEALQNELNRQREQKRLKF